MAQLYFGQGPLSSALNGVNSILEVITPTPAPTTSNDLLQRCVPETFTPTVFGTEVLALEANVIAAEPAGRQAFCNVTLSYTHPGQNDYIIVETWLPVDDWNGMFLAIGGGGWAAGRQFFSYIDMGESIDDGFATITTDAGLVGNDMESAPWALLSPGNVDLYSLQNTASVSLIDEANFGKSLIKSFYGRGPTYSYWNGCSNGGRQGMMLAQRYPTAYDGIAANAPAMYWNQVLSSIHWPYQVMLNVGVFPHLCEVDAIRAAAISACDGLDGVLDGVVANVDECLASFDPSRLVGAIAKCGNETSEVEVRITDGAVSVVNQTWHGITTPDGEHVWPGFTPSTHLTGSNSASRRVQGPIDTTCDSGNCTGIPNVLGVPWFKQFLLGVPEADLSKLSNADFHDLMHVGKRYQSIVGTDDPDLSRFRDAGGKLVTYHGLDDPLITPRATERYYKEATEVTPDIHDYYRLFMVPGLGHCSGGASSRPSELFAQLRAWVENGTAPESTPVQVESTDGTIHGRILCPYPSKARLDACEDPANAKCWSCSPRTGEKG